jgi:hypothetical protein
MSESDQKAEQEISALPATVATSRVDQVVSLAKGIVGAVPYIGPIVAEVIGAIIPNQRADRITRFLEILDERVAEIEQGHLAAKMRDEQFVDLFEDSLHQASRAISDERKQYIATLLKNSITNEELSHAEEKTLLNLLGQLSDPEIIILQWYGMQPTRGDNEFFERHRSILQGSQAYIGAPQPDLDRAAVHEAFRQNLASLGLIRTRFSKPPGNQLPEFDPDTGMMKASGYGVTALGRLLLRYLELPGPQPRRDDIRATE